jgi:protoporphyrinogen oxidase
MAQSCNISLSTEVTKVDPAKKMVWTSSGTVEHYESLISSLPLPELIKLIDNVPSEVTRASELLSFSSIALISLGFKRLEIAKSLWFYIYDEDILPARAYSPSLQSSSNAPPGKSSIQFEVYYSRFRSLQLSDSALLSKVIQSGEKMGIFDADDVEVADVRHLKYGNVIFDHAHTQARKLVANYISSRGIISIGRFGEWLYLWSDQCLLSGRQAIETILSNR